MLSSQFNFPASIAPKAPVSPALTEPFDRTPAQVIKDYDQKLRDRSSKLIEVSSFLAVLKEELEAGTLQLTGQPGVLDYALNRLDELTA